MDDPAGTGSELSDWAANYTGTLMGSGSSLDAASAAVPEPASLLFISFRWELPPRS